MTINFLCLKELDSHHLFENSEHRSRFSELISCYCNYPFFSRGLCKCMYLSSWDMEHFMIMLDILNDMTLGKSSNVNEMKDNGKVLEETADGYDQYIFKLSGAFLSNTTCEPPDADMPEEGLYLVQRALEAAEVLDEVFNKYEADEV